MEGKILCKSLISINQADEAFMIANKSSRTQITVVAVDTNYVAVEKTRIFSSNFSSVFAVDNFLLRKVEEPSIGERLWM